MVSNGDIHAVLPAPVRVTNRGVAAEGHDLHAGLDLGSFRLSPVHTTAFHHICLPKLSADGLTI